MARKYLPGGALNPAWCDEQDAERISEDIEDLLNEYKDEDIDLEYELSDNVNVVIHKSSENPKEVRIIQDNDYEAKFKFLKDHSATPEDLELAKLIIGLK